MGIVYNTERKLFNLFNDNISYKFFVNDQGYLQHLYFGSKVEDFDFDSLTELGYEWGRTYLDADGVEKVYEDNFYIDHAGKQIKNV